MKDKYPEALVEEIQKCVDERIKDLGEIIYPDPVSGSPALREVYIKELGEAYRELQAEQRLAEGQIPQGSLNASVLEISTADNQRNIV